MPPAKSSTLMFRDRDARRLIGHSKKPNCRNVNFRLEALENRSLLSGVISGEVYNDLTGSGVLAAGDPGLQGWKVSVFNSSGSVAGSATTGAGGNFSIGGLNPGTYTVSEQLQSGWTPTAPASPGTFKVTLASGGVDSGLNFGNFQNTTISGEVFNDLNGDGKLENGEPGLANWTVTLLASSGEAFSTKTNSSGAFKFSNLGPGSYAVLETTQAGWVQTLPTQPSFYRITPQSGADTNGLNFGNFQLVTVSGEVYNDLNDNGKLDPGEPGLQGSTVNLENSSGAIVATTTSNANGVYHFSSVAPGSYIVAEILQSGWTQTQPVNPNNYSFSTHSGLNETSLNFGNFAGASLTGTVYNDLAGDGIQASTDPLLAGWTLDLLDSSGDLLATTTSNSSGNYAFNGLMHRRLHRPRGRPARLVHHATDQSSGNLHNLGGKRQQPFGPEFWELQADHCQRQRLQRPGWQWPPRLRRAGTVRVDCGLDR